MVDQIDQTRVYTLEKCDCSEALLEDSEGTYCAFLFFRIHTGTIYGVGNAMVPGPGRSNHDNCRGTPCDDGESLVSIMSWRSLGLRRG